MERKIEKSKNIPLPPRLSTWEKIFVYIFIVFALFALFYLVDQFCFKKIFKQSIHCTYISLGWLLITNLGIRLIYHKKFVHKARLVDKSQVDSLFVEVAVVEPKDELSEEVNFKKKKEELDNEVNRLKNEIGSKGWTEYQILSLDQMLVEFLDKNELISRAKLSLAELEDYALDSAFSYDQRQYNKWQIDIENAIKSIENVSEKDDESKDKDIMEQLRASLSALLEHIAGYEMNWAMGSQTIRAIMEICVASIPILFFMALLPSFHSSGDKSLYFFNWGFLGIIGSISAVLLNLRKSNLVEVGNTEGKQESMKAFLGSALGFVAGILMFSMIAGEFFTGSAFPNLINDENNIRNLGLSIIWAIASGYSFEWIFDRLRNTYRD